MIADLLGFVATLVWAGFGVFVILVFRALLPLTRLVRQDGGKESAEEPAQAAVLDLEYAARQLDRAAEVDGRDRASRERRAHAIERARRSEEVLRGARVLWVHERPERVLSESRMLQGLGASLDS